MLNSRIPASFCGIGMAGTKDANVWQLLEACLVDENGDKVYLNQALREGASGMVFQGFQGSEISPWSLPCRKFVGSLATVKANTSP